MKNNKGRPLDGFSMKPLLEDPQNGKWDGPDYALTALYKWAHHYDPALQNYSLRFKDWRYIRYENGKEELYHTAKDQHEWNNLALNPKFGYKLSGFQKLLTIIPKGISEKAKSNDYWKAQYFTKNPSADLNADGNLSWSEFDEHKNMTESQKQVLQNKHWKNKYFQKNPSADTNQDGVLTWPELHTHKKNKRNKFRKIFLTKQNVSQNN